MSPQQVIHQVLALISNEATAHPFIAMVNEDKHLVSRGIIPFIHQPRKKKVLAIYWEMPPPPFVKLNIDGSSLGNPGLLGGGGVIRNHCGDVLQAFSSFYGLCTNMEAEANALLEGIKLCNALGFGQVLAETDSQALLQAITCNEQPWRIDHQIAEIKSNM